MPRTPTQKRSQEKKTPNHCCRDENCSLKKGSTKPGLPKLHMKPKFQWDHSTVTSKTKKNCWIKYVRHMPPASQKAFMVILQIMLHILKVHEKSPLILWKPRNRPHSITELHREILP